LDGLVRDVQHQQSQRSAQPGQPLCPKCGRRYERASGFSPNGVTYFHADRTECSV
jgi:hypothetical protein